MSDRHSFSSDNFYVGSDNVQCPTVILSTVDASKVEGAIRRIKIEEVPCCNESNENWERKWAIQCCSRNVKGWRGKSV